MLSEESGDSQFDALLGIMDLKGIQESACDRVIELQHIYLWK